MHVTLFLFVKCFHLFLFLFGHYVAQYLICKCKCFSYILKYIFGKRSLFEQITRVHICQITPSQILQILYVLFSSSSVKKIGHRILPFSKFLRGGTCLRENVMMVLIKLSHSRSMSARFRLRVKVCFMEFCSDKDFLNTRQNRRESHENDRIDGARVGVKR